MSRSRRVTWRGCSELESDSPPGLAKEQPIVSDLPSLLTQYPSNGNVCPEINVTL